MNNINYYNVNKICFDKLFETIDAKRVIYDVVALLEHLQIEGAFLDKVVPLFTLINSYIVATIDKQEQATFLIEVILSICNLF